jgi:hypothetical protein
MFVSWKESPKGFALELDLQQLLRIKLTRIYGPALKTRHQRRLASKILPQPLVALLGETKNRPIACQGGNQNLVVRIHIWF